MAAPGVIPPPESAEVDGERGRAPDPAALCVWHGEAGVSGPIIRKDHLATTRCVPALLAWTSVTFAVAAWSAAGGAWAAERDGGPAAAAVADLDALEQAFAEVVDRVTPSVVGIRARRRYVSPLAGSSTADGAGTFEQQVVINGSGTVVGSDGLILTNEHVVHGAHEIEVALADGTIYTAVVLAADTRSDLAVLRIAATGLTPVRMCDWRTVRRGQWNIALGNPFGLGSDGQLSVSVGVIANLGRALPGLGELDDRLYADMIQTTAAIHPGNSGGPLFNIRGELVGVVTAVHARGADDEGVGFAIPMTPGKQRIVAQLVEGRTCVHGYLGVTVREPEPTECRAAGLAPGHGVVVEQVEPDGPADQAGVQVADLLTRFAGQTVESPMQLAALVDEAPVGQAVALELRRGAAALTLHPVIGRRDVDRVSWMRAAAVLWRGLRLADLTPESRARLSVDPAAVGIVVIGVLERSPAARAGLAVGDVIEGVDGVTVRDVAQFLQRVRGKHGPVSLRCAARGPVVVEP